eukprot:TRINITY_DN1257_c0_g1_i10.p1 TRINITY_DN1257_c0_g1~~TRINITY_DN1257_c0_g1_i10.p1  ORF type:complete len:106 (+),score=14.64 TRINITY_DN1257_c0_g1_i10:664-981(+)
MASGYFDRDWVHPSPFFPHIKIPISLLSSLLNKLWEKMKQNSEWIVQFHSPDDHLVPIREGSLVASKLCTEYFVIPNEGHFQSLTCPEILEIIGQKIKGESRESK